MKSTYYLSSKGLQKLSQLVALNPSIPLKYFANLNLSTKKLGLLITLMFLR